MSIKKKIIFSSILIVLCLGMIEFSAFVALKILEQEPLAQSQNIFHPLRHHAYRSNIQLRDTHGGLFTDGFGYIKNAQEIDNPEFTILLTGASSLGTQTPFTGADKTISSRVEKLLQERFKKKIKVQSLSVTSYPSFFELMILYEYLEDLNLQADMVVSVNGLYTVYEFIDNLDKYIAQNSLYDLYDKPPVERLVQYTDGKVSMVPRVVFRVLLNFNISTMRLFQYIWNKGGNAPTKNTPTDALSQKEQWMQYKDDTTAQNLFSKLARRERMNYELMHQVAKTHDIPFLSVLLPAAYTWDNWPVEKMTPDNKIKAFYQNNFYAALSANETLYPVFDFSTVFDYLPTSQNPYTEDDTVHYNDIGTEIIAQGLYEKLVPYVQKTLQ